MLNKNFTTATIAFAVGSVMAIAGATAEPVNDALVIDGETLITVTKSIEGHPLDEVRSGWLYRTKETRGAGSGFVSEPWHALCRTGRRNL